MSSPIFFEMGNGDCILNDMPIDHENDQLTGRLSATLGLLGVALAGGAAIFMCARHFSAAWREADEFGFDASDDRPSPSGGRAASGREQLDADY